MKPCGESLSVIHSSHLLRVHPSLRSEFMPSEPVSSSLYLSSINIVNVFFRLSYSYAQITNLLHLKNLLFASKEQALTLC
nr:MAG TPA: hypothetical protein [Caudoviricetes sp.]DAQ99396.1 MAG TPA: hypothetical protein [Caudoviricetes sp.]